MATGLSVEKLLSVTLVKQSQVILQTVGGNLR